MQYNAHKKSHSCDARNIRPYFYDKSSQTKPWNPPYPTDTYFTPTTSRIPPMISKLNLTHQQNNKT